MNATGGPSVVLNGSTQGVAPAALAMLSTRINHAGGSARHMVRDRSEAVVCAAEAARPGDVVVLMGTGDIAEAGQVLRAALGELSSSAA